MNNRITLEFGDLDLMQQYAVIARDEGVEIDSAGVGAVRTLPEAAYAGKNFGLIASRVKRDPLNALAPRALFTIPDPVAGAIVSKSRTAKIDARLEGEINDTRTIEYCADLEKATHWIQDAIDNESRNS